jgi:hypothetical protein
MLRAEDRACRAMNGQSAGQPYLEPNKLPPSHGVMLSEWFFGRCDRDADPRSALRARSGRLVEVTIDWINFAARGRRGACSQVTVVTCRCQRLDPLGRSVRTERRWRSRDPTTTDIRVGGLWGDRGRSRPEATSRRSGRDVRKRALARRYRRPIITYAAEYVFR